MRFIGFERDPIEGLVISGAGGLKGICARSRRTAADHSSERRNHAGG